MTDKPKYTQDAIKLAHDKQSKIALGQGGVHLTPEEYDIVHNKIMPDKDD